MLSGLKIVEICGIGPGPFCAMHLADLGAEVIAVERAASMSITGAANVATNPLNRGKRSMVADLQTVEGREAVLAALQGGNSATAWQS